MLDIGWSELLLLGVIALLVVGPKELPAMMRAVGRYVGILKRHADEFRSHFSDVMQESEIQELKKELQEVREDAQSALEKAQEGARASLDEPEDTTETDHQTESEDKSDGAAPASETSNAEPDDQKQTDAPDMPTEEGPRQRESAGTETIKSGV